MAKQAIDELIASLEAGQSERLTAYLSMLGKFHRYSLGNVLLIHMQRPGASRIAGYGTWRKLGRQVRRGERAIRILAPVVWKDPLDEEDAKRIVAFQTAYVFDVAQTDGKALPAFAQVAGAPGLHLTRLRQFVRSRGITVNYFDQMGAADGLSAGGAIVLRADLEPAAEFAVMAHEAAHELLHYEERTRPASKTVRETEAEAVAFVVCQAVGLEARSAASDYIRLYQGTKETLLDSLDRIQRTAVEIIEGVLKPEQDRDPGRKGAIVPLPQDVKRLVA